MTTDGCRGGGGTDGCARQQIQSGPGMDGPSDVPKHKLISHQACTGQTPRSGLHTRSSGGSEGSESSESSESSERQAHGGDASSAARSAVQRAEERRPKRLAQPAASLHLNLPRLSTPDTGDETR